MSLKKYVNFLLYLTQQIIIYLCIGFSDAVVVEFWIDSLKTIHRNEQKPSKE